MQADMITDNIGLLRPQDQLKFIIDTKDDYDYALSIINIYKPRCEVVMQPVWGSDVALANWIIRDEIDVRLSMQLHKILWRDRKGL